MIPRNLLMVIPTISLGCTPALRPRLTKISHISSSISARVINFLRDLNHDSELFSIVQKLSR